TAATHKLILRRIPILPPSSHHSPAPIGSGPLRPERIISHKLSVTVWRRLAEAVLSVPPPRSPQSTAPHFSPQPAPQKNDCPSKHLLTPSLPPFPQTHKSATALP